ncbi:neurotensin receptor type 1 [Biomphalaria glabrata]|nr:neurotensin receptor type 1-like [Biomphalaria glabrata]
MVGIPGNCLVIAVYITKMTMKPLSVFIISMAVIDLMTCTFILPVEIYILLHSYDFTSVLGCQLYIFFSCLLLINSDLTPVSIAIIRYKMVCTPHQRQVTFTQAKRLCCLNVCIAFIASIPQLLLQGIHSRRTPIPDIVGHHCQVDDSYVPTVWPGLSSAFLFLFFILSCTTVTYMYFHIRIKVKSQRNKFQKRTRSRLSHIVCELTEGSMVLNNTDIHSYHTTAVASSIVDLSCISKDGSGIDIMGDHNFAIENDSIENVLQTGNESDVPINCPNIMSEGKHVSINDCIVSNVFMTSQNSPESRKARLI